MARRSLLLIGTVFGLGLLCFMLGGGVLVASATQPPGHKVTICHATGSTTNPMVEITVDIASSGYLVGGHNFHAKDIIPPYTYGSFSYPGKNWTAEGQAILRNHCKAPANPSPSPSPVPSPSPTPEQSPSPTPSQSPSPTPSQSPTPTPSQSPTPTSAASPSPTPAAGGVAGATATTPPPTGGVLAETGSTAPGQGLGAALMTIGLLTMTLGAIAWRRRSA
jgi:hypothetical protein